MEKLEFRRQVRLMGSAFEFVVVDTEACGILEEGIAEVKRIESLLTEFDSTSETSRINHAAGVSPVRVVNEVYALIERCQHISGITQGAFDITAAALKKIYNFNAIGSLPPMSLIKETLEKVGYEKIQLLHNEQVFLPLSGMHVNFAAIGKGYAADCVKKLFQQKGIRSGVVSASGDLTAWGKRADGTSWRIGIANPNKTSGAIGWIPVDNMSVATSGNYEQYFVVNGKTYSHNINPRNGLPVTGIKSTTVVSAKAELSDALATAVTVMGSDVGLHFVNQLPNVHCLIIDEDDRVHTSRHLKLHSF